MSDQDEPGGGQARSRSRFLELPPIATFRYTIQFSSAVIGALGLREGAAFLKKLQGIFGEMGSYYGPVLGNLVLFASGAFNGCRFCGVGHLYGANVDYYLQTGKFFPVNELEILELYKLPFRDLQQLLLDRLAGTEFAEMRRVIERIFALRMGQVVETDEDRVLMRVLDVWYALGECTIRFGFDANPTEIPPLLLKPTPMKDIRRYNAAREAQRRMANA